MLKPEIDYATEQGCALCRNKQYFKYASALSLRQEIVSRGHLSIPLLSILFACPQLSVVFSLLDFSPLVFAASVLFCTGTPTIFVRHPDSIA